MKNPFLTLLIAAAGAGCTVQQPVPNLAGQDIHLTVVHTADLHSRFFPYYFAPGQIDKGLGLIPKTGQDFAVVGGIGRVSTVVKCIRGIYTGPPCDFADLHKLLTLNLGRGSISCARLDWQAGKIRR